MHAASSREFGWTGLSAMVDLSSREVRTVPTSELRGDFVGGRAAAQAIIWRRLPSDVPALDPRNLLILSAGPLVGTSAPASSRVSVDTKGLVTGGVSSSNAGGYWAPELKFAGFDGLIIHGRAAVPTYLLVEDGRITFHDAGHLWGRTTWETEDSVRQSTGDPRLQLLSIGPAGERLAPISCVIVGRARAAGHGGCGAVMGSKNLKAVACRGTGAVRIASPQSFQDAVRRAEEKISASRAGQLMRQGGTHLRSGAGGFDGTRPAAVRNSQDERWDPDRAALIREPVFRDRHEVARLSCFNCSMYCSHYYSVADGLYEGTECEGVQANTVRGFGSNVDVVEPSAILRSNAICSQYGLDVDGASNVMAWAFELFERGILTAADTGGLALEWGDHQAMNRLLEQIARGEGLGALLSQGAKRAAEKLGRGSAYYALTNRGHDLNESALRSHKAWALGVMTSARGGGHLNGAPSTEFQGVSDETSSRLFGVAGAGMPQQYEGKADVLVYFERLKAVVDALGMCYFTSQWIDTALLGPADYADLYGSATGQEQSAASLMTLGEQVVNLERVINHRHAGYCRQDDYPPERLVEEPVRSGAYAGERLDRRKWEEMLDRYYALHGWDSKTGLPTDSSLSRIGLGSES